MVRGEPKVVPWTRRNIRVTRSQARPEDFVELDEAFFASEHQSSDEEELMEEMEGAWEVKEDESEEEESEVSVDDEDASEGDSDGSEGEGGDCEGEEGDGGQEEGGDEDGGRDGEEESDSDGYLESDEDKDFLDNIDDENNDAPPTNATPPGGTATYVPPHLRHNSKSQKLTKRVQGLMNR